MAVLGPQGIHGTLQLLCFIPPFGGVAVKQADLFGGFILSHQIVGGDGEGANGCVIAPALVDDLGADSIDFVEIVMELEKAFGITIKDDEAEHLNAWTVGDLYEFVKDKL